MTGKTKSRRAVAGILAAGAMAAALGAPGVASADVAAYPDGGSTFSADQQGWTGIGGPCGALSAVPLTCSTSTEYSATEGNPAGSINSRIDVIVNGGGLLSGQTTYTSPDFTVPDSPAPRVSAVALDRRLDGGGLVALQPESTYAVSLIDRSAANKVTPLATETVATAETAFSRKGAAVPAGAIVAGHRYALSIQTTTTTRAARVGLLGSLNTRYDNVVLSVDDSPLPAGTQPIGDGAAGSTGVTIRSAPLADGALGSLANSVNENAEVGRNTGGSLLPTSKCTIVGTAGKDRIQGTKGNDVICGLGGNDRIDGAGGNDVIDTGDGNDIAGGTAGNDVLIGVRGKDRLTGAAGADRLGGGASADRLNGTAGNDRLNGGSASDRLVGGAGGDRVSGAAGNDRLDGGKGNDRLNGGKGRDRVAAGAGNDRINVRDRARDLVDGGTGRDTATVDRRKGARTSRSAKRADSLRRVERKR